LGAPPPTAPGPAAEDPSGAAAAKARDLIAELSGGQQTAPGPSIPSQPPGGGPFSGGPLSPAPPGAPATPYLPPGPVVPSFGDLARGDVDLPPIPSPPIPSYAPTEPPPGLGFPSADPAGELVTEEDEEPPSPGQWSDGSATPPPGRSRRSRGGGSDHDVIEDGTGEAGQRRLPVLLLLGVLLLGGAYLVKTQLLDSDSNGNSTTVTPRASAPVTVPGRLSAAELAASLKDAHFKHGYDWGRSHGAAPAADREQLCRTEALKERAAGYPWGAHDRAGCLVALAG
jgi:hypothetical protein